MNRNVRFISLVSAMLFGIVFLGTVKFQSSFLLAQGDRSYEEVEIKPIPAGTTADEMVAEKLIRRSQRGNTQSESLLKLPITQGYLKETPGLARHQQIIDLAFQREREYKKRYWVFYTAIPYMRLFQDVTRKLYKRVVGRVGTLAQKKFQFIRYTYHDPIYSQYKDATQFLLDEIKANGMVDDNDVRLKTILVSTNLSFFGNLNQPGESTYSYFNNPQAWVSLNPDWLRACIKSFGYPVNYTDDLINLAKTIVTDTGDLFQIFIPKPKTDKVGYLSWRQGIPFDIPLIEWLFERSSMSFSPKDKTYHPEIIRRLADLKKKWLAKDPETVMWVNQVLENVRRGKFRLSPYLTKFVQNPNQVPFPNTAQGRLLITNKMLLDPRSGILVFRYSTLDLLREKIYKQRLSNIIQQMELEKQRRLGRITVVEQRLFDHQLKMLQMQRDQIAKELLSTPMTRTKGLRYRDRLEQLGDEQEELFRKMQERKIPVDEFTLTKPTTP